MSSIFSNRAGAAKAASADYIKALLELVGGRDPLTIQRELVGELRRITLGLAGDVLRRPEAPGKWSMLELLEHLGDQELVTGFRYRKILAEDEPAITGYDQDLWSQRLHYGAASADDLIADIATLRNRNLRLLAALSDAELDRVGIHAERGPESIRRLTELMAAHDLVHRRQLERIRAAVTG